VRDSIAPDVIRGIVAVLAYVLWFAAVGAVGALVGLALGWAIAHVVGAA